jgi:hypothetical protein
VPDLITDKPDEQVLTFESDDLGLEGTFTIDVDAQVAIPPNPDYEDSSLTYQITLVNPCRTANFDSIVVEDMVTHVKKPAED